MMLVVEPVLPPEFGVGVVRQDAEIRLMASIGGLRTKPPSTPLTLSAPSIRKLFDSGRCPLTA